MVEKKIITVRTRTHIAVPREVLRPGVETRSVSRDNVTDFREENNTGGYVFFLECANIYYTYAYTRLEQEPPLET